MHYVPAWVKDRCQALSANHPAGNGEPIDVLSPNFAQPTWRPTKTAFTAPDGPEADRHEHTFWTVPRFENESATPGSVRDKLASGEPASLPARFRPTCWPRLISRPAHGARSSARGRRDFQVYHQARYINEVVAAGKAEFNIPCYINVWLDYPPGSCRSGRSIRPASPTQRRRGAEYVGLWRTLARRST